MLMEYPVITYLRTFDPPVCKGPIEERQEQIIMFNNIKRVLIGRPLKSADIHG